MHKEGDVAKVGHALCEIEMQSDGEAAEKEMDQEQVEISGVSKESEFGGVEMEGFVSAEHKHSGASPAGGAREVLATPAVRRVSREHKVDLSQVQGTGRDGRITKEDVLNFVQRGSQSAQPSASSPSPTPSAPVSAGGTTELIDLTPVQRAMFKAMTATLSTPHFAYSDEIDVTELDSNLAASPKGLAPADLKPTGTITLSNVGAVGGGTYTHPLLPPTGQLAIGALGRSRILPRFASEIPSLNCNDPDKIVRRLIMSVSFTGDHRVVEGADLARLVNRWKQLVENPSLWLGLLA
ncbi:hypothetical protein L1887_63505 [Cichorium endivia]|nr:hypothetical protein L1887_63505 [Cichorium endivia]